jgi:phage terminase small subunit
MVRKKTSEPATPPPAAPPPPGHLSPWAQALWRCIACRRARSPERLTLFLAALEALDRATEAREILAREGLTTKTETTGAVHVHPLAKVEAESRRQFGAMWDRLGLSEDPSPFCKDPIDLGPFAPPIVGANP